jgi:predicted RNA-binding protein with PIN domain
MKIYVDGNTLLGYLDEQGDSIVAPNSRDKTRQNLARWLARYCRRREADAVVVFEGQGPNEKIPRRREVGRVTVLTPPYEVEAHDEIAAPANREARSGERVTVVTDDWKLARVFEKGAAKVQSCEQFVQRVRHFLGKDTKSLSTEPDAKFSGVVDEEVDYWMDFFEFEEED